MRSVEQRVADLEGRGEEYATGIIELRHDVRDLRADVGRRFDSLDARFTWMIGVQFATMLAVIGALLNAYFR